LREREIEQNDSLNEAKISEVCRNEEKEKSVVNRAKLFGDVWRGTLSKMPQDAVELVLYFNCVKPLFVDFGVEKNYAFIYLNHI